MNEPLIIILLVSGTLFWMLGGTYAKWLRRIVWTIVVASMMLFGNMQISIGVLRILLCSFLVAVSVISPYGDRTPWPVRLVVFLSIASPGVVLNWHIWPVALIGMVLLQLLFMASRRWNWVSWKIWEAFAGFVQAAVIVMGSIM